MAATLQPVTLPKSPRYRELAYTAIKEAILAGQLEPEQPLVEESLAALLQISRTPVREALALLEHEGLIGPGSGRGLYIRRLTRAEFVEMFVANETVEPYLARRAALLATEAQVQAMERVIMQGRASLARHEVAGFLRSGRDFHRLVGEAADNRPLTEFVLRNEERTDLYLLSYGKDVNPATMAASIREHEAILEAISRRDPEAAAWRVIYHTQSLRDRLADLFNDQTEGDHDNGRID